MNRREFAVVGAMGLLGMATSGSQQGVLPAGLHAVQPPTDLPPFSLPDVDGRIVRSGDLLGNVLILRFWATW